MNGAKIRQQIAFSVLGGITLLIVVPIILVILYIVINGAGAISWQFLTQAPRSGMKAGGIFPAIVGTILLVLGTMLFSLPLGVLSAIYLVEYARDDLFTRMIKLSVVNLSGIPSIVYGLFGFTAFVLLLHFGTSILAGSLTLAIMSLPVIITASKEALESVPFTYREISLSLGATKWQTIRYCVLPYAIPGILTGTVLSLSRAAGETAPILFTVAAFYLPRLPHSAFDQVMALPYHLYVIATQVPNIPTRHQLRHRPGADRPGLSDESRQHHPACPLSKKEVMVSEPVIKTVNLDCFFGSQRVLRNINIEIPPNEILGIIGPANSGKTTFLRALNRLNYLHRTYSQTGEILLDGRDIRTISDNLLRKKIGIIFALPQVLPVSIFDNVAYGPKVHGVTNKETIRRTVEEALKRAYLWEEVKDRLPEPAVRLSGGQQQRLCIARTLAVGPQVILYDEPCSGLDPISTAKVEDAMQQLKADYTQILVTNNTKQASRVSERCAFFLMGELVEIGPTQDLFTNPQDKRTDDYITGRFG